MEQGWHVFIFSWSYELCIKIFSWSRGTGHISHLSELKGAGGDPSMAYRQEMNQFPLLSTTAAGEDWAGNS